MTSIMKSFRLDKETASLFEGTKSMMKKIYESESIDLSLTNFLNIALVNMLCDKCIDMLCCMELNCYQTKVDTNGMPKIVYIGQGYKDEVWQLTQKVFKKRLSLNNDPHCDEETFIDYCIYDEIESSICRNTANINDNSTIASADSFESGYQEFKEWYEKKHKKGDNND